MYHAHVKWFYLIFARKDYIGFPKANGVFVCELYICKCTLLFHSLTQIAASFKIVTNCSLLMIMMNKVSFSHTAIYKGFN